MQMDPQLKDLLVSAKGRGASDVHISVGAVPRMRVNGNLVTMEDQPRLLPDDTRRLLFSIIDEEHLETLKREGEVDLSFGERDLGRFRLNVYRQRGSYAAAIRLMNEQAPAPEELRLPDTVKELYRKKGGLVLVTGPTGSGKSTTLACLIRLINENRYCHVLTLEDPIEYTYRHNKSLIDQREIGLDSKSFSTALRAALREDPDVILVGEMRDLETISTAITAAETGHLVFSSLHTNSAAQTISRIIDVFPEGQKDQIRSQLALVLETVVSQRLVPRADGKGRVACYEVMHCNKAIQTHIRENKIYQIDGTIQNCRKEGMITMAQALKDAERDGLISRTSMLEFLQTMDQEGQANIGSASGNRSAGQEETSGNTETGRTAAAEDQEKTASGESGGKPAKSQTQGGPPKRKPFRW